MTTIYRLTQPLIAGSAYVFYGFVGSQADTDLFQTTVTLATGDAKLSKDGASFENLGTLPVETDSSGLLTITLSTAETTGITKFAIVKMTDAAGDEWQDVAFIIPAMESVTVSDGTLVTLADNAITAAKIATDAITSDELAASATAEIAAAVLTTAMTESYAADGATATLAQGIYELLGFHNERNIGAFDDDGEATLTIKKRDGSETAMTFTITADSITRIS